VKAGESRNGLDDGKCALVVDRAECGDGEIEGVEAAHSLNGVTKLEKGPSPDVVDAEYWECLLKDPQAEGGEGDWQMVKNELERIFGQVGVAEY
jgi:hypothetical protein